MKKTEKNLPWAFLDTYRGSVFQGEWPSVSQMFAITVKRYPDRPCFTDFDPEKKTLTYAQVLENVEKLAQWMLEQGAGKGDRIAVTGKNSPEWATVYLAVLFAGCIIVPIDYGLHEKEVDNLLKASKPKIFFVDEEKYSYFEANSQGAKIYSLSKLRPDLYVYNLTANSIREFPVNAEEDTAAILFTSGTTGVPKGVMLSHKNLVADCYIAQTNLDIFHNDVFYALLPIHHSYTMFAVFIEALSVGAEIVFGKSMAVSKMLK
ncbi:MAG TPA: AMP-binding protein, partial [Treponemataceae bacterium]|nr:AMP-binding protein [Treponemataceae bacterium]